MRDRTVLECLLDRGLIASPTRIASTGFTPRSSEVDATGLSVPRSASEEEIDRTYRESFSDIPYNPHLKRRGAYGPGPPGCGGLVLRCVPSRRKTAGGAPTTLAMTG